MNAFIDSPKLIVNGFGAWQGTLGEAFRLNRDRMASHLAFLCTSWDVDTGSSPLARGLCDRGPLRVLRRRRTGARGAEDWKFSLRYGILVPRSSARKEQPWVLLSRP